MSFRDSCTYPNGLRYGIAALLLAVIALIFSAFAVFDCYFFKVSATVVDYGAVGLWYTEDVDVEADDGQRCKTFSSIDEGLFLDSSFKAGRVLGSLAAVLSVVILITIIGMACVEFPNQLLKTTSALSLVAGLCMALSFIAFNTEFCKTFECSMGMNAGLAIGATIAFFFTALVLCKTPKTPK